MRMLRLPTLSLLASAILAGCVATGGTTHAPPSTDQTQQAQAFYTTGHYDEAAQAYLNLAVQDPANADYYNLLAAEAYRQKGNLGQTAQVVAQIRRSHLEGDDAIHYDLLRAEVALKNNDPKTALSLTGTPEGSISPALQVRLVELRARAQAANGDHWTAAQTRIDMDAKLKGMDREQNRKQALAELAALGQADLASRDAALPADDRLKPWIHEAQSQLGVSVARAPAQLNQPVGTMGTDGNAAIREGYKVPHQVALLLPTSGPLAGPGSAIRDGFFAAYIDAGRNNAPRPIVKVYDSGADAAHANAAYDLAVKDGAQLVVGPLNREGVGALFSRPQLPVPVLALNHPTDRVLPPAGTSEFGLLPESEGAQVADHMIDRGILSATTIVNSDDFATRAGKAFAAEYAARGGHLLRSITLAAGGINFADQLQGIDSSDNTGIFISMRPQDARLLMPQLHLAKITAPVFATSHIYAGVDDATNDKDLDGVEFCDAPWLFDAQPGLPRRADLNAGLPSSRGVSARLFAFGMDAWALVPYLDWLRQHIGSYLPGATGQLTADEFGRVRRVLIWARFQDGIAHPAAGSLELEAPATSADDGTPAKT